MMRKLVAEVIGSFMWVSAVCAGGVLSSGGVSYGFAALGVGLAVAAMMYASGHVSGGHFNPAVTCGLVAAGRHPSGEALQYIVAQVVGAILAAFLWYTIAGTNEGVTNAIGNFASNGYGAGSPDKYRFGAVALAEIVAAAVLVYVFVGATSKNGAGGMAPLAVGFAVAALLLITQPVSNGALNPARATATALFGGALALQQFWLFWVAPIIGAVIGGLLARYVVGDE